MLHEVNDRWQDGAALPACLGSKTGPEGASKPASAFREPLHLLFLFLFSVVSLFSGCSPPRTTTKVNSRSKEGNFARQVKKHKQCTCSSMLLLHQPSNLSTESHLLGSAYSQCRGSMQAHSCRISEIRTAAKTDRQSPTFYISCNCRGASTCFLLLWLCEPPPLLLLNIIH